MGCAATLFEGPPALIAACGSGYTFCSGFGNQSFRTTFRFHSCETSEKIPLACACPFRGIVSANRCKTAVGFSRPVMSKAQGATLVRRFFSAQLYGGRAQGAFGRAGFRAHRSTNLRTAATHSFSRDMVVAP